MFASPALWSVVRRMRRTVTQGKARLGCECRRGRALRRSGRCASFNERRSVSRTLFRSTRLARFSRQKRRRYGRSADENRCLRATSSPRPHPHRSLSVGIPISKRPVGTACTPLCTPHALGAGRIAACGAAVWRHCSGKAYMYRICRERGAQSGCPKSLLLGGPMNGNTLLGAFRVLSVLRVVLR